MIDDDGNGCLTFEVSKGRFGFKLTVLYDENHPQGSKRTDKENYRKLKETRVMKILSCEFNMDAACVELKFDDGSMIAIDTLAVENKIDDNMYQRSEPDYPIYNDPVAYDELILNGDPEPYLKAVSEYKPLDS